MNNATQTASTVSIRYDETWMDVPAGKTILTALEASGIGFVRGVGCRGGICGACAVLYRIPAKSHALSAALMCQENVQEGMEILPLPYVPQTKVPHCLNLLEGETPGYHVLRLYPEVNNCIMCGECVRVCPKDIDVMGYVGMIKRGDLKGAAQESFTCIGCQICVLRCPSSISQPNAALAARRWYGRFQQPQAEHLTKMVEKIETNHFAPIFRWMRHMDHMEFQALYLRREYEPDDSPPGTWLPDDQRLL
ncbi:MAG: 2Fe-2S iron-sulfur cluster binding domain-containing protein [Magnetococcales bacterium]|nr:2Fe-2S iron-sulfur cluster binding domain-containing protein [Magnetococcales bacterium]MBF0437502.1 2Fe-2S iron-sulfur cluster binding domain-containing protein [Magnetococcales bacterium]